MWIPDPGDSVWYPKRAAEQRVPFCQLIVGRRFDFDKVVLELVDGDEIPLDWVCKNQQECEDRCRKLNRS